MKAHSSHRCGSCRKPSFLFVCYLSFVAHLSCTCTHVLTDVSDLICLLLMRSLFCCPLQRFYYHYPFPNPSFFLCFMSSIISALHNSFRSIQFGDVLVNINPQFAVSMPCHASKFRVFFMLLA